MMQRLWAIPIIFILLLMPAPASAGQDSEALILPAILQWVSGSGDSAGLFNSIASFSGLCGSYAFVEDLAGGNIVSSIPQGSYVGLFSDYPGFKILDDSNIALFATYSSDYKEFAFIVDHSGQVRKKFNNPSANDKMFGFGEDGKIYIAEGTTLRWYSAPWDGGPSGNFGTAPQTWTGFGGGAGSSVLATYSGGKYYAPIIDSRGKIVFGRYTMQGIKEVSLEASENSFFMAVNPEGDYYLAIFRNPKGNSANRGYTLEARDNAPGTSNDGSFIKEIDVRPQPNPWYSGGYFLPLKQITVDGDGNIFMLTQFGILVFDSSGALLKNYLLNPNPGTYQGNQDDYLYNAYMMDFDAQGNVFVLSKPDLAGNIVKLKKYTCVY